MPFEDKLAKLAAPFPVEDVEWLPTSLTRDKTKGLFVAYVSARAVQERFDDVVGPLHWRVSYHPGPQSARTADVMCTIALRPEGGEWIEKSDGAPPSDIEPVKGGYSDAFRRAAVLWGVGRYLYKVPGKWMEMDPKPTKRALYEALPAWAKSGGTAPQKRQEEEAGPTEGAQRVKRPKEEPKKDMVGGNVNWTWLYSTLKDIGFVSTNSGRQVLEEVRGRPLAGMKHQEAVELVEAVAAILAPLPGPFDVLDDDTISAIREAWNTGKVEEEGNA